MNKNHVCKIFNISRSEENGKKIIERRDDEKYEKDIKTKITAIKLDKCRALIKRKNLK